MNKAFTLLELVVVIVILGVLATLGFTQYGRMVERARGAEAKAILGDIRKLAIAYRLANGTIIGFAADQANANIGTSEDQIPGTCRSSHYFRYSVVNPIFQRIVITATRCISDGKDPQGLAASTLTLTVYFALGTDSWGGTGGY